MITSHQCINETMALVTPEVLQPSPLKGISSRDFWVGII
jgi:hypothetical protein